jgi:brefeldin A-inhibited guanine nucleotide-exchange protein
MCQDPTALVEIFLNYDADFESVDLFRQMVDALARCAKTQSSQAQSASAADALVGFGASARQRSAAMDQGRIRKLGLKGLGAILKSLVQCASSSASAPSTSAEDDLSPPSHEVVARASSPAPMDDVEASATHYEAPLSPGGDHSGGGISGASSARGLTSPQGQEAVESFDRKQRFKEEQQRGILQFNLKPSTGLKYLEERGHLQHEPRQVAKFLHTFCDQLDKTVIGDYLGKEKEYANGFCVKVLHEYIDMMDFEKKAFDEAIRHFLAGFRLPGEAQKIDRMMEKFAERYCIQNAGGVFPSADTAFVLAFSIIMLNTDLHNPAIADDRRMTKAIFRRQVEGIANGGNLPDEYLDAIYDRIKKNPISLKDDEHLKDKRASSESDTALAAVFGSALPVEKRRMLAFHREREDMVKASESLFQVQRRQAKAAAKRGEGLQASGLTSASSSTSSLNGQLAIADGASGADPNAASTAAAGGASFRRLSGSDLQDLYVRPMFDVAWGSIVGTLSFTLEAPPASGDFAAGSSQALLEDQEVVGLCLAALQDAIHLASALDMATARATLVNALAKFTTLDSVREMKPRHIECVKCLLRVAVAEGNTLGEAWEPVLQCISRLYRLTEGHGSGGTTSDDFFEPAASRNGSSGGGSGSSPARSNSFSSNSGSGTMSEGIARMVFGSTTAGGTAMMSSTAAKAVEEANAAHLLGAVDELLDKIDRIFAHSTQLDSAGIQHFVTQLSKVAHHELHSGGTKSLRGWEATGQAPGTGGSGTTGGGAPGSSAAVTTASGGAGGANTSQGGEAGAPRVFCLQKLVEVAAFNMESRPRLIWSTVWGVMSDHFASAGLHPNVKVAMYAIDSLRQLSVKFLTKDELRDFNFQRLFLKPFEAIMRGSKHGEIRELVVLSVDSLVQARLHQLRSGWKPLLAVLGVAAHDPLLPVANLGFACLKRLATTHADLLAFDFTELTNALLMFAACPSSSHSSGGGSKAAQDLDAQHLATALEAIELVRASADRLGSGVIGDVLARDPRLKAGQRPTLHGKVTCVDEQQWQLWWPLLYGLAQLVGDPRGPVRLKALDTLGGTLLAYGGAFSDETWRLVFKGVIFPVMESAWTDGSASAQVMSSCPTQSPPIATNDGSSFITSTAKAVFSVCIDLFGAFPEVADTLLHETLSLLTESICQEIETLARIAADALVELVYRMPSGAPPRLWTSLCDALANIACRPLPPIMHPPMPKVPPQQLDQQHGLPPLSPSAGASSPFPGADVSAVEPDADAYPEAGAAPLDAPFSPAPGAHSPAPHQQQASPATAAEAAESVMSPLARRSAMAQLVVTKAVQAALQGVLEAYYLDLNEDHLTALLDSVLSSAAAARLFHAEVELRQQLAHNGFMVFPGSPGLLPHLVEQESNAYALLLDTLGRLLALEERRAHSAKNAQGSDSGAGGSSSIGIVSDSTAGAKGALMHTPAMQSPGLDLARSSGPPSAAAWAPKVRAHGSIYRSRSNGTSQVFAFQVSLLDHAQCFPEGRMLGAPAQDIDGLGRGASTSQQAVEPGDFLLVSWPRGSEVSVQPAATFAAAYVAAEPTTSLATHSNTGDVVPYGAFASSRLTYVFQLLLDEYALKDGRAAHARNTQPGAVAASLQAETSAMTPLVVQVLLCLGQCSDEFLRHHLGWMMPSMCELIRCRDDEVRVALHHIMVTKLSPILTTQ